MSSDLSVDPGSFLGFGSFGVSESISLPVLASGWWLRGAGCRYCRVIPGMVWAPIHRMLHHGRVQRSVIKGFEPYPRDHRDRYGGSCGRRLEVPGEVSDSVLGHFFRGRECIGVVSCRPEATLDGTILVTSRFTPSESGDQERRHLPSLVFGGLATPDDLRRCHGPRGLPE